MKLNNKGFAITAVLYGLLILFVLLIGSYLLVLSAKKNRVDTITSDLEQDYIIDVALDNFSFPLTIPADGTYVFSLTDNKGNIYHECTTLKNIKSNTVIEFDTSLKMKGAYLVFDNETCNDINQGKDIDGDETNEYVVTVNKITYNGKVKE